MAPLHSTRRCVLLAPVLAIACGQSRTPAPPRRHVDATTSTPVRSERVDATAQAPTADAGPPRPPLDLFVVGGADLLRPGSTVPLRLEREGVGGAQPADVTRAATFRVQPATAGRVDSAGIFHGLAAGRAEIIATDGTDEARAIVEVTTELPAGVTAAPTLQVSDGRIARSIRFGILPDGTVLLAVQATNLSLSLRGRRRGNTLPITVPMEESSPRATGDLRDASATPPAMGTLVIDRMIGHRLDGHAALEVAGRPLQLRFTVLFGDASPLLRRVDP